ncbi:10377_t:CDS:10 [Ambispora leptoticha]|uniref:10377_t:CDS:1 n=1 Tax=Ambispora leptoticha TaxID=144679 RepID=A0A9N8YS80_9GLOM|nr:10377_t:CDS:10 [Ambispora leptoticha]
MRPARKQVDESILKEGPNRGPPIDRSGTYYNIWYNKWTGSDKIPRGEKAKTRCNAELDVGETKGDKMSNAYFCLFFARGCCPFGYECNYLHRIPDESDPVDSTIDAFGRDKFNEYREDMGGVGSFNRENRTLYVGHIYIKPEMEETVRKHFGEWGEIEKIKILKDKGVAFVTYKSSLNAEFAKEAMSNQSLDSNEVLNVRWATDDPNPKAKEEYKRKAEALAAQAIQKHLPAEFTLNNADYEYKRPRLTENSDETTQELENHQSSQGLPEQPMVNTEESSMIPDQTPFIYTTMSKKGGILSEETLQTLKSLSMINRSMTVQSQQLAQKPETNKSALGGLADYESDEEVEIESEAIENKEGQVKTEIPLKDEPTENEVKTEIPLNVKTKTTKKKTTTPVNVVRRISPFNLTMNHISLLPPSPNWNASKACSLSEQANIFVYATNELLILLNLQTLKYIGYLKGHSERVNALETCDTLCVSGSNDKSVRCWDMLARKETAILEGHKASIFSLDL